VLSDPQKRKEYDQRGDRKNFRQNFSFHRADDIFKNFFKDFERGFGGGGFFDDDDDFFGGSMFGNRGFGGARGFGGGFGRGLAEFSSFGFADNDFGSFGSGGGVSMSTSTTTYTTVDSRGHKVTETKTTIRKPDGSVEVTKRKQHADGRIEESRSSYKEKPTIGSSAGGTRRSIGNGGQRYSRGMSGDRVLRKSKH